MKQIAILVLAASLYACSPADNDPGPGGVSVGEARALDEAAEMIEAKRLPEQQDEAASDQTNDAAAQDD